MAITINQKPCGWLWHWESGPGWVRDGREIRKLYDAGMEQLRVQLQDDGPIPVEQVKEWREDGKVKVWGAVGHVNEWESNPKGLAAWLKSERVRLSLTGLDCNFEEDVRGFDERSDGKWSAIFAPEMRRLCPTLPLHLDTYYGPAAAKNGINLGAYLAAGFKYTLQSYWGNGIWDDPPTRMVAWTSGANPRIPKAIVKPLHRVVAPDVGQFAGQLPNWEVVFSDWELSGLKGGGFYYIDGADFDLLLWLFKECIRRGVAYQ